MWGKRWGKRSYTRAWLAVAIGLLSLATLTTEGIANPCALDSKSSGELQVAASEGGIVGTGMQDSDPGGIGGTGYGAGDDDDESGIGGTGLFGTITGFGSICINGYRVHYGDDLRVEMNGEVVTPNALAIGQVVYVVAEGTGQELQAQALEVHTAVAGPITELDAGGSRVRVMSQWVEVSDADSRSTADYEVAQHVRVSGLRRSDGTVVATRIGALAADAVQSVSGLARTAENGALQVAGLSVEISRDSAAADELVGHLVRARGRWNGERAVLEVANVIRIGPRGDRAPQYLSIEGYLGNRPGREGHWLGEIEVDAGAFAGTGFAEVGNQRVHVRGTFGSDGRLHIDRFRTIERPGMGGAIDRPAQVNARKESGVNRPHGRDRPPHPDRPPRPDRPEHFERRGPPPGRGPK